MTAPASPSVESSTQSLAGSRRGRRPILALLLGLLTGSTLVNVALFRLSLKFYREMMNVRLDPTDASRSFKTPEPGRSRIVYLGDSRVEYWLDPPGLATWQVLNRGIGGETTAQVLLRLDRDVLALNPQIVVLQAGVNDLRTLGLFAGENDAITRRCLSNLETIIDRLRTRGVVVVVTTIFPVGRVDLLRRPVWSDATIDAIDRVNQRLRALARPGVLVLDADKILRRDQRIEPTFAADLLHLSPSGYEALNESLRSVLESAAVPVAQHR